MCLRFQNLYERTYTLYNFRTGLCNWWVEDSVDEVEVVAIDVAGENIFAYYLVRASDFCDDTISRGNDAGYEGMSLFLKRERFVGPLGIAGSVTIKKAINIH